MNNSLIHVGLHVLEKDVLDFYKEILDCQTKRTFTLQPDDAFPIFGINQEVTVQLVSCGGIELELFAGDKKNEIPTFGHLCFQSTEADKIFDKACKAGFRTFIRKRNLNETYFISDNNNNLFEIKKPANNFQQIESTLK